MESPPEGAMNLPKGNIVQRAIDRIKKGPQKEKQNETEFQRAESFVDLGLDLIKKGDYETAINHFENWDPKKFPSVIKGSTYAVPIGENPTPETLNEATDILASHTHFNYNKDTKVGFIIFSRFIDFIVDKNGTARQIKIDKRALHESALLHAEEWIHIMQELNGGNLTIPNNNERHGHEHDVAIYLFKKDVPMTYPFLRRYTRNDALSKYKEQHPAPQNSTTLPLSSPQ